MIAHAQNPDFVFEQNGRVHLNRRGCQFSRLPAAEVCASAVVMLDTPCSEVECKTTGYSLHSHVSPSPPLPCVTLCHHISNGLHFLIDCKRMSPFKSAGASAQSITGSQGVRICGSNAGYTMFRGTVKGTGYPLHSPVSPSLPLQCVTVCRHISTGLYFLTDCKRTSPFKLAGGVSVQSTTGSRGVCISGSNAGYTMFRGSVKGTGYPLHSPVSPSVPLPCVTVCHHISTGLYFLTDCKRTSPFKSAGASVQSTTGSRGVRISGSNAGYTMF